MYLWQSVVSFQICKKSFTRRPHLEEHMILHSQDKPFKCTYCEEHFKSRFARLKHQEKFHLGIETSFWHVNTRFKVKHSPTILCPGQSGFHPTSFYNSLFHFWGKSCWKGFCWLGFYICVQLSFWGILLYPKKSEFWEGRRIKVSLIWKFFAQNWFSARESESYWSFQKTFSFPSEVFCRLFLYCYLFLPGRN